MTSQPFIWSQKLTLIFQLLQLILLIDVKVICVYASVVSFPFSIILQCKAISLVRLLKFLNIDSWKIMKLGESWEFHTEYDG